MGNIMENGFPGNPFSSFFKKKKFERKCEG